MSEVVEPTVETPKTSARDAALAALGDDFSAPVAESATTDDPLVVEPPKVEPPKPEPLSPQLAQLAKQERHNREQATALKAEQAKFQQERQEWEASKGNLDAVHREVSTDIVSYADRMKWTPKQRHDLAVELSWSAQPEDKRPAGWRRGGQVLTELDQVKQQALKAQKELDDYKASQAKEREEYQARSRVETYVTSLIAGVPEDATLLKAFMAQDPEQGRRTLYGIAAQLAEEDPDADITPAMVSKRAEELLDKQTEWYRKARGTAVVPPALAKAAGAKVAGALSNAATASPTRQDPKPQTMEERKRLALDSLGDDFGGSS